MFYLVAWEFCMWTSSSEAESSHLLFLSLSTHVAHFGNHIEKVWLSYTKFTFITVLLVIPQLVVTCLTSKVILRYFCTQSFIHCNMKPLIESRTIKLHNNLLIKPKSWCWCSNICKYPDPKHNAFNTPHKSSLHQFKLC